MDLFTVILWTPPSLSVLNIFLRKWWVNAIVVVVCIGLMFHYGMESNMLLAAGWFLCILVHLWSANSNLKLEMQRAYHKEAQAAYNNLIDMARAHQSAPDAAPRKVLTVTVGCANCGAPNDCPEQAKHHKCDSCGMDVFVKGGRVAR